MLERVFLGWQQPGVWSGTDYLLEHYTTGGCCDLSQVTVVLPGGRAQRRLLDALAQRAGGEQRVMLVPPRMVTPGQLFEVLCPPAGVSASPLETLLAWTQALRGTHTLGLGRILPHPPHRDDLAAWLALARDCARLHQELAGADLTFGEVAAHCGQRERDYCDGERWEILARLHGDYLRVLAEVGREDRHEVRRQVLTNVPALQDWRVILFCTPDLNATVQRLLREGGAHVTALIQAPEETAPGFDDLGGLDPNYWSEAPVRLQPDVLRIVDRPRDQAAAIVDAIAELQGRYSADGIVVGLGDPEHGPIVERALTLAGLPARSAAGIEAISTGPALLLAAIGEYLDEDSLTSFAALVRHPDLERWLTAAAGTSAPGAMGDSSGAGASAQQLALESTCVAALLDRYAPEHLPARMGEYWAEAADTEMLRAAHAAIAVLLGPFRDVRLPLPEWSDRITEVLRSVFGQRELDRSVAGDLQLVRVLEGLGSLLREQAELDAHGALAVSMNAGEVIRFTLDRLQEVSIPAEGGEPAIELLGWLELYLDDAQTLIVTGLNDGAVPESVNGDAFLPDRLRRALGLLDNQRRYARDALVLRTLTEKHAAVRLISGRRSTSGEPLTPSRLLFAADDRTVVERALAFYGAPADAPGSSRHLLRPGREGTLAIPRPKPTGSPLKRLRVTAFGDYLACPYRFYLRHVCQLATVEEAVTEMDGGLFGDLMHKVLDLFACSSSRDSTDAAAIRAVLREALASEASRRFGPARTPAVQIQLHQAGRRLAAFADWQAQAADSGWQIAFAEQKVEAKLEIDGSLFTIHGRIDRIDRHASTGRCRLIDYKTGDSASTPDRTHRVRRDGSQQWVDLQLPLYRRLAASLDVNTADLDLGYVLLPKDAGRVGWQDASWSPTELQEADEEAFRIVRAVRAEQFWPPSPLPPRYPDGLEGLCMDRCVDRRRLVGGMA